MAKYQTSTMQEYFMALKEDIKAAIHGKAVNHDNGTMCPISPEEAEKLILESVDEIVFHAINALLTANTIEKIAVNHGYDTEKGLTEYMKALDEIRDYWDEKGYNVYKAENELHEQGEVDDEK